MESSRRNLFLKWTVHICSTGAGVCSSTSSLQMYMPFNKLKVNVTSAVMSANMKNGILIDLNDAYNIYKRPLK